MPENNIEKTPRIAVLGGTGRVGSYVVNELISRGISIKLLVRSPEKIPEKNPLIEIVMGSAKNYTTIQRLVSDCQAVISTLGPSKVDTNVCSTAVSHVIRVMKQLNIRRYIEVAGLGLHLPGEKRRLLTQIILKVIKTFYPQRASDRFKCYELLKAAGIDWTIVRCPTIEPVKTRKAIRINLEDSPATKVNAADVAAFLVDQVNDTRYFGKCPFISN